MKNIYVMLFGLFLSLNVQSQSFEWIKPSAINFNFNPSYPEFPVVYDEVNNKIIHARLDSFALIYSQSVLGQTFIESRDTNGIPLWQMELGDSVFIQRIAVDDVGDIIVGGHFRGNLKIGATDSLNFLNISITGWNFFLLKLSGQGNLIWKRNLSATWPDYNDIHALKVDPFGNCWYATTDFFVAKVASIDANGNDVTVHTIENGKTIGNIDFDPSGGMYISGGAENGIFVMNTDTFFAPNDYNMFIARFNAQGQPSWAHFGHDITFQRPMITTDPSGNVFFAGMRFDSTSFNGVFIPAPIPFGDFFGFKADTACNIQWVLRQPSLLIGPFGIFEPGKNLFIDADAAGNFYMGGIHQGMVDWGNGYTSSTSGFSDRKSAIALINSAGSVEWVKIGGSNNGNYLHALAVSDEGSCYFTGSFSDTASFDNNFLPTSNFYNFMLGKIRVVPTGIDNFDSEELTAVFPNPAKDEIHFSKEFIGSEIKVFDLSGRLVLEEQANGTGLIIISSLTPGSYIIQFANRKFTKHSRFLKYE